MTTSQKVRRLMLAVYAVMAVVVVCDRGHRHFVTGEQRYRDGCARTLLIAEDLGIHEDPDHRMDASNLYDPSDGPFLKQLRGRRAFHGRYTLYVATEVYDEWTGDESTGAEAVQMRNGETRADAVQRWAAQYGDDHLPEVSGTPEKIMAFDEDAARKKGGCVLHINTHSQTVICDPGGGMRRLARLMREEVGIAKSFQCKGDAPCQQ